MYLRCMPRLLVAALAFVATGCGSRKQPPAAPKSVRAAPSAAEPSECDVPSTSTSSVADPSGWPRATIRLHLEKSGWTHDALVEKAISERTRKVLVCYQKP